MYNFIRRQLVRLKNWKIHLYNLTLQTTTRVRIILECVQDSNPKKRLVVRHLLKPLKLGFLPYSWVNEYAVSDDAVKRDKDGYPYVCHEGRELFFPKEWDDRQCANYYISIICEQDDRSPHKYLTEERRRPEASDVVADIGAAEGNFSLEIIDSVKKIYLFEKDEKWMIPLRKTFSQYLDKVEIVKEYIAETIDSGTTTLDAFFVDKEVTYVKADIEGFELCMLKGGAIL